MFSPDTVGGKCWGGLGGACAGSGAELDKHLKTEGYQIGWGMECVAPECWTIL